MLAAAASIRFERRSPIATVRGWPRSVSCLIGGQRFAS